MGQRVGSDLWVVEELGSETLTSELDDRKTTQKHLRGSGLLFGGRIVALLINFATQVVAVRYLAKADYGIFAYVLSLVSLATNFSVFGMEKAAARFAPIYHEREDYPKMFGTIAVAAGTVLGLGIACMVVAVGLRGLIERHFISDHRAASLLLILVLLVPVNAFDKLLLGLFAVFAGARSIFFRKHLLGPCLKLAAVLIVAYSGGDVELLAMVYVAAGIIGTCLCGGLLVQVFRRQNLWRHFRWRGLKIPAREVFFFSVPLLWSELISLIRVPLAVILLGYFHSSTSVAEFRAVLPAARLNELVAGSFAFLFLPAAARLFSRNGGEAVSDLYWRTTVWISTLSFPLFIVSFVWAEPLAVFLFGPRYGTSGTVLAILSLGYFFNAALGFNALTLRVFGKVRCLLAIDIASTFVILLLNFMLIPKYGALGAAYAMTATFVVQNLLNQAGLLLGTGIPRFPRRWLGMQTAIVVLAAATFFVQRWLESPLYMGAVVAGMLFFVLIALNKDLLRIGEVFPELQRLPLLHRWLESSP